VNRRVYGLFVASILQVGIVACTDESSRSTSRPVALSTDTASVVSANPINPSESTATTATSDPPVISNLEQLGIFNQDETQLVFRVREILVARCMSQRGFLYDVPAVIPVADGPQSLYPDPGLIAQYGYGWRAAVVRPDDPTVEQSQASAPGFFEAFNGTSSEIGCGVVASDELGMSEWYSIRQVLANEQAELETLVDTDPDNSELWSKWAECMTSSGFQYGKPSDAEAAALSTGDPATPENVQLAVHDYGCRMSTGYAEGRREIHRRLVIQWIESNPDILGDLQRIKDSLVERAGLKDSG
jgi:hypothetical protein